MRNRAEEVKPAVGMVGLGIMGSAMAANLAKAKFAVIGYDPVPDRRRAFARAGGKPLGSVEAVAKGARIIVLSLPSADALAEVAAQLARSARRGTIVVETSTLPIPTKEAARVRLARSGVTLLDCPLSGTGAQARTRDLVVFASGPRTAYRQCTSVFEGFARRHRYAGPFGTGSKLKFIANLLVSIHNVAAAEAMVLGMKAGIEPAEVLEIMGDSAGSSRMLQVRGPLMVANRYRPATMKNAVWQKDVKIIGEFARSLACPTPLFDAASVVYVSAMAEGLAEEDTGSVCRVLERWAGHERIEARPKARRKARGKTRATAARRQRARKR
jgi:3-hydroxyisobutyrate dehydrogenase-like beta-hydroxyacid dehydrogenase